ncbi:sigma-54-dependent Fis family transcriptional regulator [candidate division KSB1 bacterium]|nr:sigma-54-dependent Fis family transcriptional regulator [candidate division KSB1 bacterium]
MKPLLLIIDDDKEFINDFTLLLEKDFNCISALNGREGIRYAIEKNPDVVLLDLMLGEDMNGLDVLSRIRQEDDNLPVIIITDYGSIDTAVEAMRFGAFDYIPKTPNIEELKVIIEKSLKQRSIKFQTQSLQQEIRESFHTIVGDGPAIRNLCEKIALCAQSLNTVIITGESGVGKELVARQIHLKSDRKNKSFVPVNCAAIPKELLESELFGHEKGAFTGANKRKIGKFEIASEGIIFFDEISELDLNAQVKLLRVLQEKEFERVGGNTTIKTDAKIIAATNRDLEDRMRKGLFREDLFYRLDVLPIRVPPLRERKEDIPLLIDHFLQIVCTEIKIPVKKFSPEAIEIFMNYDWPGNVRELRNYITRAVILSKEEVVQPTHLEPKLIEIAEGTPISINKIPETLSEMDMLRKEAADKASRAIEKLFLTNLLKRFNGNVSRAAVHAGINRTNFHKMMKRCEL